MTREETKQILAIINAIYPNFKVTDMTSTVNAWCIMLDEFEYKDIELAVKTFVRTSGKGFPPSVDQLIAMTRKPEELTEMGDGEAWSYVSKAIKRSSYYAEHEFLALEALNPAIAKAVGSASQLRAWAIDEDFNESVVSSNFMRSYRTVMNREREMQYLPKEARAKLEQLQQKALLGIGGQS